VRTNYRVDSIEHAGRNQFGGPVGRHLLGMLKDETDRSAEHRFVFTQNLGYTEGDRRVGVMSTCVHHPGSRRRVSKASRLSDLERVDVGAQSYGRTITDDVEIGYDARFGRMSWSEAELSQLVGNVRRGLSLLEGNLWMPVQVPPPCDERPGHPRER
jgi:hypothetical protein